MKESRKIQSKKRNVNGKSLAKKLFLGMVMFLVFFMVFLRACFKDLWFIDGTHFRARSNCSKHA